MYTRVAPFTGAWIEIFGISPKAKTVNMSHPSRVRGLKYINPRISFGWKRVAPFTGAWIEIANSFSQRCLKKSHPSRVRGLKYSTIDISIRQRVVAPFTGAWIEMRCFSTTLAPVLTSHPSRVRGLKYILLSTNFLIACRRTLHGCVD